MTVYYDPASNELLLLQISPPERYIPNWSLYVHDEGEEVVGYALKRARKIGSALKEWPEYLEYVKIGEL